MPNRDFEYLPKERKVVCKLRINILEKMQQQLDYIANAMHDTGFTPSVRFSKHGRYPSLDTKYKYEGREQGIYFHIDLDALDVDETIVTLVLPNRGYYKLVYYDTDSSRCSLLEKVSQRYFISLVVESSYVNYIPYVGNRKCKSPTILQLEGLYLTKIKWISFGGNGFTHLPTEEFLKFFGMNTKEMLPEPEKLKIKGNITDRDCELLSKLISDSVFTGKVITIILGRTNFYKPYLNSMWFSYNNITDDGALKLINACKSKEDAVISLSAHSRKISSNTQDKLKKLNNNINNTIKLMTSLVKEGISSKKEESKEKEEFEEIVQEKFLQILKEDILEVFWKLKDNPKIHKMISEKLNHAVKDNTANAQTAVKTALAKANTAMVNKYILPDIKDIKDLKDLPAAKG